MKKTLVAFLTSIYGSRFGSISLSRSRGRAQVRAYDRRDRRSVAFIIEATGEGLSVPDIRPA